MLMEIQISRRYLIHRARASERERGREGEREGERERERASERDLLVFPSQTMVCMQPPPHLIAAHAE